MKKPKQPCEECYRLKADDPRFKLRRGDILVCIPYRYDDEKLTVMYRASDGFDPSCNVYRCEVERVLVPFWMRR